MSYNIVKSFFLAKLTLNPVQDGHFHCCSQMWGRAKGPPPPKICQTYPTTEWPATRKKPLNWLIPLKRSLKYPENWDGP